MNGHGSVSSNNGSSNSVSSGNSNHVGVLGGGLGGDRLWKSVVSSVCVCVPDDKSTLQEAVLMALTVGVCVCLSTCMYVCMYACILCLSVHVCTSCFLFHDVLGPACVVYVRM